MPTITVTVSAAEAARLQEAALAAGFANQKQWLIALSQNALKDYERRRDVAAAQGTIDHYDQLYQPIAPS